MFHHTHSQNCNICKSNMFTSYTSESQTLFYQGFLKNIWSHDTSLLFYKILQTCLFFVLNARSLFCKPWLIFALPRRLLSNFLVREPQSNFTDNSNWMNPLYATMCTDVHFNHLNAISVSSLTPCSRMTNHWRNERCYIIINI